MTIDKAIKEHQKVIEVQEKLYEDASTNESKEIIKNAIDNDRQLVEWLKELKEAKRLLKAAVEDLNATATEVYNGGVICECCKWESQIGKCSCPDDGGCDTDYQWRYADEALKLIGED